MPLPYQYRDYPLAVFMGLAFVVMLSFHMVEAGDREVAVVIPGTCCTGTQCPVVDSLAAVLSTSDVKHQLSGNNTVVSVRTSRGSEARQIWDAITAASIQPIHLTVDGREYASRP